MDVGRPRPTTWKIAIKQRSGEPLQKKIVIPGTLPGLNEYIDAERGNRYQAAELKRKTEEMIVACIMQQIPGARFREPVHIKYIWYEPNRRRDKDNIAFGKKFIQDALVMAGILEGDGWRGIGSFTDTFAVDKHNPRVEVIIETVEKEG